MLLLQGSSVHNYLGCNNTVRNQDPIELALCKHTKDGSLQIHKGHFQPLTELPLFIHDSVTEHGGIVQGVSMALKPAYSESLIPTC